MELKINKKFQSLLPKLSEKEYELLRDSIILNGVIDPIVISKGFIIDGHNRYEIATKYDKNFEVTEMFFDKDKDIEVYMLKNQLGKRNLTDAQKIIISQKLHERTAVKAKKNQSESRADAILKDKGLLVSETKTQIHVDKEVAKTAGVSESSVTRVKKIMKKGTPKLKKQLLDGEIKISAASFIVSESEKISSDVGRPIFEVIEEQMLENSKLEKEKKEKRKTKYLHDKSTKSHIQLLKGTGRIKESRHKELMEAELTQLEKQKQESDTTVDYISTHNIYQLIYVENPYDKDGIIIDLNFDNITTENSVLFVKTTPENLVFFSNTIRNFQIKGLFVINNDKSMIDSDIILYYEKFYYEQEKNYNSILNNEDEIFNAIKKMHPTSVKLLISNKKQDGWDVHKCGSGKQLQSK